MEGPRVAISTIHSSIGREAEHVFLVAFQDPIQPEERPGGARGEVITYTALIRARMSLRVSTSYPNLDPYWWFDPETCEYRRPRYRAGASPRPVPENQGERELQPEEVRPLVHRLDHPEGTVR